MSLDSSSKKQAKEPATASARKRALEEVASHSGTRGSLLLARAWGQMKQAEDTWKGTELLPSISNRRETTDIHVVDCVGFGLARPW